MSARICHYCILGCWAAPAAGCCFSACPCRIRRPGCPCPCTCVSSSRPPYLCRSKAWVYLVDVDSAALKAAGLRQLQERPGALERQQQQPGPEQAPAAAAAAPAGSSGRSGPAAEPVVVVGCGPAGLFAALELAEAGVKVRGRAAGSLPAGAADERCCVCRPSCRRNASCRRQRAVASACWGWRIPKLLPAGCGSRPAHGIPLPTLPPQVVLLERGQPVEVRGKDIGALFVRRKVNPESNLCYGEGGAGALLLLPPCLRAAPALAPCGACCTAS